MLSLHCCTRLSVVAANKGSFSFHVGTHWDRRLLFLWSTGFNSCDIQAQLLYGMWHLPEPGIKPMSNALASRFIFLFIYLFFNWRLITLQYCLDFCHTSTCIDYQYTYVPSLPPPTPSHSLRLSQSTTLSSPCHIANSHWLSVLHALMYKFPCNSQSLWILNHWIKSLLRHFKSFGTKRVSINSSKMLMTLILLI